MSVQRVSLSRHVAGGAGGKATWAWIFGTMLDELEAGAKRDGITLDWDSLEIDTETSYEDMWTLAGDVQRLRHTSLNLAALGLTAPAAPG